MVNRWMRSKKVRRGKAKQIKPRKKRITRVTSYRKTINKRRMFALVWCELNIIFCFSLLGHRFFFGMCSMLYAFCLVSFIQRSWLWKWWPSSVLDLMLPLRTVYNSVKWNVKSRAQKTVPSTNNFNCCLYIFGWHNIEMECLCVISSIADVN